MANKKNEICFLCGKTKNQTDRLIKGKYGYIFIEKSMQRIMFDIPDMKDVEKVVVTSECVEGKTDALIYGARNKKIA